MAFKFVIYMNHTIIKRNYIYLSNVIWSNKGMKYIVYGYGIAFAYFFCGYNLFLLLIHFKFCSYGDFKLNRIWVKIVQAICNVVLLSKLVELLNTAS